MGTVKTRFYIVERFHVCTNDNELQKLPEQLQNRADATALGSLPVWQEKLHAA